MALFNKNAYSKAALKEVIKDTGIVSTLPHKIDVKSNDRVTLPVIDDDFQAQETGDTVFSDPSKSAIEIETKNEAFKGYSLTRKQAASTDINLMMEYGTQAGKAIRKMIDYNVISGMLNSAGTKLKFSEANGGEGTTELTYEMILTADEKLNEAEVPSEDRYMIVKPKFKKQLFKIVDGNGDLMFLSNDKMGKTALVKGHIGEILGFTVILSTNISKVSTAGNVTTTPANNVKDAILFYQSGCYAVGMEKAIDTKDGYNKDKRREEVVQSIFYGHGALRPARLVQLRED